MTVPNANVFVSLISTSLTVLKILLNELLDNSTYKVSLVLRASSIKVCKDVPTVVGSNQYSDKMTTKISA